MFLDGAMSVRLAMVNPKTNTDKFHQTDVVFDPLNQGWVVRTSWGRQGHTPQTKTYQVGGERQAIAKARAIVDTKLVKGYRVQRQAEKEATQALTKLRRRGKQARTVKREQGKPKVGDQLLYDLSRVTTAMHRLASTRYTAMARAEQWVDGAMASRFDTTDEGRLVKEVWGRMYEPTAERSDYTPATQAAAVRQTVHQALDDLPEWVKIQDRCRRDPVLSSVTSRHLAEHVIRSIIADFPEPETEPETSPDDQGEASTSPDDSTGGASASAAATGDISAEAKAQIRAALSSGLQEAHEKLDEADRAMDFAWGREPGDLSETTDPEQALDLAQLLAGDTGLQDLMEMVGRYMRSFRDVEVSEYGTHGTTPFSVTPDNDLRRLLPTERMGLAHPLLSLQTMYRFMQRQTLCYDVRSREPKSQGPFVICLDTSGSMRHRLTQAKAFAIAALQTAANEGRDVHLVRFNSRAHDLPLDLTTPATRSQALVDVARFTASGGTDFDNAFDLANGWLASRRDADILMITDGECGFEHELWGGVFHTNGTQVHYIHVGGYDRPSVELAKIAVQTLEVNDLDDAMGVAIRAAHRDPA
jgi:uncharacterized protein with von Willebrand factor type A (vWA) domain/predicted DNA-binding WGR domain protein